MKRFYCSFLLIFIAGPAVFAGPIEKVADLVRQGNVHELSTYFADNVEITISGKDDVYPKKEAEAALTNFFNENKPRKVTMLHKVNSNPKYLFSVLVINTDHGVFRFTYTLKEDAANFSLIEIRIEKAGGA